MNLREAIDATFGAKAFAQPLFYSYPGGLRFELSEGGHLIDQFLTAHRKASEICRALFADELTICLRCYFYGQSKYDFRALLRDLAEAGIQIPRAKALWLEGALPSAQDEPGSGSLLLAFSATPQLLPRILWCAFAADFASIRPRAQCMFYLLNLSLGVMALPYDDRGMDVVGPNKSALARLYHRHHAYLLAYDIDSMRASFEG